MPCRRLLRKGEGVNDTPDKRHRLTMQGVPVFGRLFLPHPLGTSSSCSVTHGVCRASGLIRLNKSQADICTASVEDRCSLPQQQQQHWPAVSRTFLRGRDQWNTSNVCVCTSVYVCEQVQLSMILPAAASSLYRTSREYTLCQTYQHIKPHVLVASVKHMFSNSPQCYIYVCIYIACVLSPPYTMFLFQQGAFVVHRHAALLTLPTFLGISHVWLSSLRSRLMPPYLV